MTPDTGRALANIRPLALDLGIEVTADDNFLYCNGQPIGIGCNSTYATEVEFIGYLMIWLQENEYRFKKSSEWKKSIQRYWFTPEQAEQITRRKQSNDA